MAAAASWANQGSIIVPQTLRWFLAFRMNVLAILKLRDLETFSNMFLGYDLLAQSYVPYAYFYPFGEAGAGILMIAGAMKWLSFPIAFFIGSIGAVSVFYVEKQDLKCACVGGYSKVPLGFISLTEDLVMVAMAVWTAVI